MNEEVLHSELDDALSGGGETGKLIRALDWAKTPLGPVRQWPQSLKTSVSICLNSRFPILIWWGPELVMIYNDAYAEIIGSKHPSALGSAGRKVWPEIWDTIGPMLSGVTERGEPNWADDLELILSRNGYPEECYFTFSYSPIRDESGGIGGVFTPVMETTTEVIGDRRLRTLRNLSTARSYRTRGVLEACAEAARALSANPYDLPFAAIYLFDSDLTVANLAAVASPQASSFSSIIDLKTAAWLPCQQLLAGESCTLPLSQIGLSPTPEDAWGGNLVDAIAVPLRDIVGATPVGFLLAGVSTRKHLDEAYRAFFEQLGDELAESIRDARQAKREDELFAASLSERARIHNLFMQAPAPIIGLQGPDHTVVLANEQYLRMIGRTPQSDFVGKPLAEVFPEIVEQGLIKLLDDVYRSDQQFWGNEVKIRIDREAAGLEPEGYFNFIYQPTHDARGAVDGILVYAFEVTDQVRARQEIETREEQFRVLADSIPHLAWMADDGGNIFWYNRRWYEYTGTTLEQMEGWGWQSVHDPEFLPTVIEKYRNSLASGEPFEMVFPLRGADGTFRRFLTLALPVRDASGTIIRWFGTNTDMESQRKVEDALRQSEKLAAVGRLASSIAHEINNPLEAVTNLIFLAKDLTSNHQARTYLETAEMELARTAQITTQTLRFHRQQSAPTPTEVAELMNSVLPLYRARLDQLSIELKLDVQTCPPLFCYAGEIRQVLANLVGNAIDAMPRGGTLRLRLRPCQDLRSNQPGVRIIVGDTGHGMNAQTMKRLYEPFFTTKDTLGTGLGLWVSAGIVEKHGGTLRARSSMHPGHNGTVFIVDLPYNGIEAQPPRANAAPELAEVSIR